MLQQQARRLEIWGKEATGRTSARFTPLHSFYTIVAGLRRVVKLIEIETVLKRRFLIIGQTSSTDGVTVVQKNQQGGIKVVRQALQGDG